MASVVKVYTPSPSPSCIQVAMQEGIQSSVQPRAALNEPGRVTKGPSALDWTMWVTGSYQKVTGPPSCV